MKDLGFDLKTPCDDCPFRKNVPLHKGVLEKLTEFVSSLDRGEFMHSCHKTDDRSDYKNPKLFQEKIQHCMGSILMCEKSNYGQYPYTYAVIKKDFKIESIIDPGDVFTVKEFFKTYVEWAKKIKEAQGHGLESQP